MKVESLSIKVYELVRDDHAVDVKRSAACACIERRMSNICLKECLKKKIRNIFVHVP